MQQIHNAKRNKHTLLAKALSIVLALTMCLIPLAPITVHADGQGVGDEAGNEGGGTGGMSGSTSVLAWSSNHQGYRMYVINSNLERISPVYDFVFTSPSAGVFDRTTRFDGTSSPVTSGTENIYSINKLKEWCDSSESVPSPTKLNSAGVRVGNGWEFKDWFFNGQEGTTIPGSGGGGGSNSGESGGNSGSEDDLNNGLPSDYLSQLNVGWSRMLKLKGILEHLPGYYTTSLWDSGAQFEYQKRVLNYMNNVELALIDNYGYSPNKSQVAWIAFSNPAFEIDELGDADLLNLYHGFYKAHSLYELRYGDGSGYGALRNSLDLLQQNIPLAGEGGGEGMPAYNLVNKDTTIQVNGYDNAALALQDGCYLIVEPITWLYVRANNGYWENVSTYESTRTYGTYWNLASKWVGTGGFYNSIMTKLFNNCMVTSKEVTTDSGRAVHGVTNATSQKSVADSMALMNGGYGLSMHMYDAGDFEDKDPEPEPDPIEVSGDFVLHESEISKPVSTGTKTSEAKLTYNLGAFTCDGHKYCGHSRTCNNCSWNWDDCSHSCGGVEACATTCSHSHNNDCKHYYCGHSSSCNSCAGPVYCTFTLDDKIITAKLKNTKRDDYPTVIKNLNNSTLFTDESNAISGTRTKVEAESLELSGFDYKFVIYRGDDALNYASYVNNIGTLGFTAASSKSTVTRKTRDYEKEISISLADDADVASGIDHTTTADGTSSHGNCNDEPATTTPPTTTIDYTGKVAIETYSGKSRIADETLDNNTHIKLTQTLNDMTRGRMVSTNTSIRFNPYIRMTYRGLNETVKHDVYVLSEYRREILPNDYAEIKWSLEGDNLKLQSYNWSTHASSVTNDAEKRPWAGKNKVLAAGSSFWLKAADKEIGLNTYQTILPTASRNMSEITGQYSLTEDEAIIAHAEFVSQAISSFDNAELIQWVSKKADGRTDAWEDGIKVTFGSDISDLENTRDNKASTESKYYLQRDINDTTNASRSDLDVSIINTDPDTKYYRFYSDTSGNIYMVSADTLADVEEATSTTPILTKTQGVEALTGQALFLDVRTKVVTKLLAAIERNTGNDTTATWASDGAWYNEAYAGIIIIEQRTGIKVGLGVNAMRTLVMDPKLAPISTSKSDIGTKAHATAFTVNLEDDSIISMFKGIPVYMEDPDMLFNTKTVYISNLNVQDM